MPVKLVSLNVDSAVRASRRSLLTDFVRDSGGDIFFFQETKLDTDIKIRFDGFNVFRCDIRRGWGGVLLLVRNTIPVRNVCCHREPFHVVTVECRLGDTWQRFASLYAPHGMSNAQTHFITLLTKFPNTIFGGDFNARHTSFGDEATNQYGLALRLAADTLPIHIKHPPTPTCYRSPTGSFIDKFIFPRGFAAPPITLVPSFSDHSGISTHLPGDAIPVWIPNPQRMFHMANIDRLNRFLCRTIDAIDLPLDSGLTNTECERVAATFGNALNESVTKFVPINPLAGHRIILSPPTRALQRRSKKLQRKLFRFHDILPVDDHRRILREVSLLKSMINNSVNSETAKFFTNQFSRVRSSRDAFATIRRYSGHKSRPRFTGSLFVNDDKCESVAGAPSVAESLAERFDFNHRLTHDSQSPFERRAVDLAQTIRSSNLRIYFSDRIPASIPMDARLEEINNTLPYAQQNLLTSAEEVSQIIVTRPNKKSCGFDSMPYFLIKKFHPDIILFLSTFFNHLISISYFPECWRHASITPIPKPGKDSSIISNWRPISQLNCISKIFERVIANRLERFNETANIFPDQFGFLPGHSADHALARLQADILRGLNERKVTTLVALDLRAAFDTIWHDGLIMKMVDLGINCHLIKTIQSMLTGRTFTVKLGGHSATPRGMVAGVPPGSVLGPICFNYFMYNIPRHGLCKNLQFADDTSAYVTHNRPELAQVALNEHLASLGEFFRSSKLRLNEAKSELIHILGMARDTNPGLRRRTRHMAISIAGHALRAKDDIRLLGVRVQTNNRFTKHIELRIQKARRAKFHIGGLLRNKHVDTHIKCMVYKLYIRPILTFAAPVWCRPPQVSAHQMERLRVFERACLRSAANIQRPRGQFRHVRVGRIYSESRCPRIDRFVAQNHIRFFTRVSTSDNFKFSQITGRSVPGPYPPINHVHDLHERGFLVCNNQMLLFHQRYSGDGLVYNTGQ